MQGTLACSRHLHHVCAQVGTQGPDAQASDLLYPRRPRSVRLSLVRESLGGRGALSSVPSPGQHSVVSTGRMGWCPCA